MGIEPTSSAWKADIISHYTTPANDFALRYYSKLAQTDKSAERKVFVVLVLHTIILSHQAGALQNLVFHNLTIFAEFEHRELFDIIRQSAIAFHGRIGFEVEAVAGFAFDH